jgi:NADH-quinone oxidoreductase subunit N
MPDVYEGAPVPITGFMTTGLKAAAFGSLVRILSGLGYGSGFSDVFQGHVHDILWVCAASTMVLGNFVALTQTNLKRMLAYSSIAHTGYLLMGVLAGPKSGLGFAPVVFYLAIYAAMNCGAFVILTLFSSRGDSGMNLQDLSGIAHRHPWLSFSMAAFLLSMGGIPPLAGFVAKYLVLYSAIQANEVSLVLIAVLCSAVSVYYYLRVIVIMYMRNASTSLGMVRVSVWSGIVLAGMLVLVLGLGVFPSQLVEAAKRAVFGI